MDSQKWQQTAAIDVAGQPIFVMARPDARQIWVNFAHPDNGRVQVIDSETHKIVATLEPGPAVLQRSSPPVATSSGCRCAMARRSRSGTPTP